MKLGRINKWRPLLLQTASLFHCLQRLFQHRDYKLNYQLPNKKSSWKSNLMKLSTTLTLTKSLTYSRKFVGGKLRQQVNARWEVTICINSLRYVSACRRFSNFIKFPFSLKKGFSAAKVKCQGICATNVKLCDFPAFRAWLSRF